MRAALASRGVLRFPVILAALAVFLAALAGIRDASAFAPSHVAPRLVTVHHSGEIIASSAALSAAWVQTSRADTEAGAGGVGEAMGAFAHLAEHHSRTADRSSLKVADDIVGSVACGSGIRIFDGLQRLLRCGAAAPFRDTATTLSSTFVRYAPSKATRGVGADGTRKISRLHEPRRGIGGTAFQHPNSNLEQDVRRPAVGGKPEVSGSAYFAWR